MLAGLAIRCVFPEKTTHVKCCSIQAGCTGMEPTNSKKRRKKTPNHDVQALIIVELGAN
jgi:hypothetical protein